MQVLFIFATVQNALKSNVENSRIGESASRTAYLVLTAFRELKRSFGGGSTACLQLDTASATERGGREGKYFITAYP